MIHLICGSTGAGKTTYAMRLERELNAVRFSIDEWMMALFFQDAPPELKFSWVYERVDRCVRQMQAVIAPLVRSGGVAVVDVALTTRDERRRFLKWAADANIPSRLHVLDVPRNVRWQRVMARNDERGVTHAFPVSREMFDFMEGRWERPTPDEMSATDSLLVPSEAEEEKPSGD